MVLPHEGLYLRVRDLCKLDHQKKKKKLREDSEGPRKEKCALSHHRNHAEVSEEPQKFCFEKTQTTVKE